MAEKNHKPTFLERMLFEKGKSREWLSEKSGVSYPTILMVVQGYRNKVTRGDDKKIAAKDRVKFEPDPYTLIRIAKCFKGVKPEQVYEDRSTEKV